MLNYVYMESATEITRVWRGFQCRRVLWEERAFHAAVSIQSVYRGGKARREVYSTRVKMSEFWSTLVLRDLGVLGSLDAAIGPRVQDYMDRMHKIDTNHIGKLSRLAFTTTTILFSN